MRTLKESIQHKVHLLEPKSLEHAFIVARKVESKYIWLLKGWLLTTIERTMLSLLTSLILQGLHLSKWMKEEKRDYVSILIVSIVRGISTVKINYSTYTLKRKKINN
jgi:hypothetical protein